MEHAKKQRLVGAVVLAALAVIVVPAILDFSRDSSSQVERRDIPDAPDAGQMEVLPLEVWSSKRDPQIDPDNRIMTDPTPVAEPVGEPESAPTVAESKPAPVPKSAPVVVAKPEPKPAPKPTPKPDSTKVPVVPEGAAAWVVQVASFSDEPKAFALRDKLRKAKHPVFVERGRSNGKLIYRVKVGPVLQHSEAEQRKQQIAKLTKLNGLIMKYR